MLSINQPKVSALLRYKLDGFSVERLMNFLTALGHDVEIVIKPRRTGQHNRKDSRRGSLIDFVKPLTAGETTNERRPTFNGPCFDRCLCRNDCERSAGR